MTRPSLPRLAKRLPNAAGGPFLEASRFRLILGGCFLSTTSRPNSGVPGKRFARTAPVWRPGFAFDSIEVVTWARGVRVRELSRYVLGEGAALQRSSQSGRRLSLSRHAARGCVFRYASSIPHEPRATRAKTINPGFLTTIELSRFTRRDPKSHSFCPYRLLKWWWRLYRPLP